MMMTGSSDIIQAEYKVQTHFLDIIITHTKKKNKVLLLLVLVFLL